MARSGRVGGPVIGSMAVAALALVVAAPTPGAAATGKASSNKTSSSGSGGWVVDKARFEPIDPGTPLTYGNNQYRGAMEVTGAGGGVSTINELALDDYVGGIAEVPSSWPVEALKAQAIAARSYALNRKAQSPASAPYRQAGADICNTDSCQVYGGVAREQQDAGSNWTAAVKATAGQVVLYNGAPIFAEYSSSNGGRSVAGSFPYLKSVSDPDDAASPLHHWHYSMPLAALSGVLGVSSPAVLVSANGFNDRLVYQVRQAPPPTTSTSAPPTTTTTKPEQQVAPAPPPPPPTTPPTTAPPP
ncbi:MAG: SpoIID/LytB domain-containing protein, partial [Acidimicrobiia bacterium]|nr:SpoIID/LytB domain-containing protein [Acidimicrobiia bacterium]